MKGWEMDEIVQRIKVFKNRDLSSKIQISAVADEPAQRHNVNKLGGRSVR